MLDGATTSAASVDGSALPGTSQDAIQRHYDAGNEFYRLWLDPTLTYSCALWSDDLDESLEEAQRAKFRWVERYFADHGASKVLDIGCGWGGVLRHLTQANPQLQATGLTLSAAQHGFVTSQGWDRVEVRLEGWEDHADGAYDAIVSIGAFEHFAKLDQSPQERIARYRYFFRKCHDMVPRGAPLALQTVAYGATPHPAKGNEFFADIFPESDCPRLEEIVVAAEGLFELVTLRNDRLHYARTLKVWLRNLKANEVEAVTASNRQVVDLYKKYLGMGAIGFQTDTHRLLRMQLRRL